MKYLSLIVLVWFSVVLTNCNDGPIVCEQGDYVGTYFGSKNGALCVNDDSYRFQVTAGPAADEITIDNNVVSFNECTIFSESTVLGLGEEYEGYLSGDSIVVTQTTGSGFATLKCTWKGLRQ